MMTMLGALIVYKCHHLFARYQQGRELEYNEVALPYIAVTISIYVVNYLLLQWNSKYLIIEDYFKSNEQPKSFNYIALGLLAIFVVIFFM